LIKFIHLIRITRIVILFSVNKPRWSGNPNGLSGPLKGCVILEYLSSRFNFTQANDYF